MRQRKPYQLHCTVFMGSIHSRLKQHEANTKRVVQTLLCDRTSRTRTMKSMRPNMPNIKI